MRIAKDSHAIKQESKAKIAEMIQQAQTANLPPVQRGGRRKKNANVRTITAVSRKVEKIQHRRELPNDILTKFVAAIKREYPDVGFEEQRSSERVLAHYRCPADHKRSPNWPFILSTSANKFYYDEAHDEVFVGNENTY